MKRLLFVLMLMLCLTPALALLPSAVSETDSGLIYRKEGEAVVVVGWNAAGTVMTVPETIEGLPVRAIANQACRGEAALTEVHLPSTVVTVGEYAFAECPNLTKVTLAGGESIGFAAFRDCQALLTVALPETLHVLEDEAFRGCTMLREMAIPASVTTFGYDVFNGCERLILNVEANDLAASYAEQYAIATSFTETWEFTLLMAGGTVILIVAIFLMVRKKGLSLRTTR